MTKRSLYKVIIAGGRDFADYELLERKLDLLLNNKLDKSLPNHGIEIVSGTARGADSLGEVYAKKRGFAIKRFPANWDLYKKRAGYIRNSEMAEYADACVVFWDRQSRGSKHMIDLAQEKGLSVRVVFY